MILKPDFGYTVILSCSCKKGAISRECKEIHRIWCATAPDAFPRVIFMISSSPLRWMRDIWHISVFSNAKLHSCSYNHIDVYSTAYTSWGENVYSAYFLLALLLKVFEWVQPWQPATSGWSHQLWWFLSLPDSMPKCWCYNQLSNDLFPPTYNPTAVRRNKHFIMTWGIISIKKCTFADAHMHWIMQDEGHRFIYDDMVPICSCNLSCVSGAINAVDVYILMHNAWDDLDTFKVACQDDNIAPSSICL